MGASPATVITQIVGGVQLPASQTYPAGTWAAVLTMAAAAAVVAGGSTLVFVRREGTIGYQQAMDAGAVPLRQFLLHFTREKDIQLFLEINKTPSPATPNDLSLLIIAPAYILSEIKAAFQIGAVLFLPFLVIDIVVASVSLSIGMVQLPPVMVSAPFKILLFVVVDGWTLLVGSLMKGLVQT